MAQLLEPGMLKFEIKPENSIKFQPVAAGKNRIEFQPIFTEEPENELETLWATAKSGRRLPINGGGDQKNESNVTYVFNFQFFFW